MATAKKYRLVAAAFRENFSMSGFPSGWDSGIVTESKESRAKAATGGGQVFAYKFGALTFINVDPQERVAEIATLSRQLNLDLHQTATTEEFCIDIVTNANPRVEYNRILLDKLTPERTAVIAQVIAQSAAMECYEQLIESVKKEVMDLVNGLADKGRIAASPAKIYKAIGYAMAIRNEIIGVMHLLDKPDLIWEDKIMDGLYSDLRAAFDLDERHKALEYKLNVVQETLEILADTVKDSRSHRLEWTIVIMIAVEIVFTLMARFSIFGW